MAIFTSTSSYSDPIRALSIKALEKRLADVQANAQEAPASMPSPWQGAAHVMGKVGEGLQLGRSEGALAAQRQALAQAMGRQRPDGSYAPEDVATITGAAPEIGERIMQQIATARENAANRAAEEARSVRSDETTRFVANQQVGSHLTGINTQTKSAADIAEANRIADAEKMKAEIEGRTTTTRLTTENQLAIEKAKEEAAARKAEEDRKVQREQTQPEAVKLQREIAVLRAAGNEAGAQQLEKVLNKSGQGSASDVKAMDELDVKHINSATALNQLKRTKVLLEQGIDYGHLEWLRTSAGQAGIKGDYPLIGKIDPEMAARTKEFYNNMDERAIGTMSSSLSGPTTNFELSEFKKTVADRTMTPQQKAAKLQSIIDNEEAQHNARAGRFRELGREPPKLPGQVGDQSGGGGATKPSGEVREVASEAEALKLPPGTRFKLPGGRTGTAR